MVKLSLRSSPGSPLASPSISTSSTASFGAASKAMAAAAVMKIETDKAHILSGVRHGKTIGSPIAIEIVNRDWKNWEAKLPVDTGDPAQHQAVASPRPGHADLAGALKYNFPTPATFWSAPRPASQPRVLQPELLAN